MLPSHRIVIHLKFRMHAERTTPWRAMWKAVSGGGNLAIRYPERFRGTRKGDVGCDDDHARPRFPAAAATVTGGAEQAIVQGIPAAPASRCTGETGIGRVGGRGVANLWSKSELEPELCPPVEMLNGDPKDSR